MRERKIMTNAHSALIGDLGIVVSRDGFTGEGRAQFRYVITLKDSQHYEMGNDLHSGVGQNPTAREMLATLLSFLGAYGDAYRANMAPSDDYADIPAWLQEACYMNADEIAMTELEMSDTID